jgi:Xaa-Pro aminopeptidase
MRDAQEFARKREWLGRFLTENELDGVVLTRTENFAWMACGGSNVVVNSAETGVGTLVVGRDAATLVANNIECERLMTEELDGLDVTAADPYPWHEPEKRDDVVARIAGEGRFAADDAAAGLPPLPLSFGRLRYGLTPQEVSRYMALGADCTAAMEMTARATEEGMTETEIAARLSLELRNAGILPAVLFVAADDRISQWRHAVTKAAAVERYAMLVTCGRRGGLIAAITRFVHFGDLPEDLVARHQAVSNVDAAAILSTEPGRRVSDIFVTIQQAYADNGYPGEWQKHHQGGAAGYQPREYTATESCPEVVVAHQAFAWNPSITGTKCEDTVLAAPDGVRMITEPGEGWPRVEGHFGGRTVERAGMLVK